MTELKFKINKDYSRDSLFDAAGITRLKDSYMRESETSPQDRIAFVSAKFASNQEHAQRLYDYASKHWLSYSTPILSFGKSKQGLPISCFSNYLKDTSAGLVNNLAETNWLSMIGGGVGVHFNIRSADDKSVGVMPHVKTYDSSVLAYKQGSRRGSYALYLDISHPDIIQFLEMRKPTGDPNLRAQNLNHAINITDSFMQIIENCTKNKDTDDSWPLIDPHTQKVKEIVSAKDLWQKILTLRAETGEPYLWFIDTANAAVPEEQKKLGLKNNGSNLCSEITLVTSPERTFVCCLSSVNIEYYDEWKVCQEQFLGDVLEMLDNVMQYFIDNAPDTISRARYAAERERSVGVGALGFHAYLQKHNIAFESPMAKSINMQIFKNIKRILDEKNKQLAIERGMCPDSAEFNTGKRMMHTMAIAPNASTSILMNTSPSIEPYAANCYRQDTSSGALLQKNKYLDKLLKEKAQNKPEGWYEEIWANIAANNGSVQQLEDLTEIEKQVFKTFREIDQLWVIEHAADRQKFIDQGQSINVAFNSDANIALLHAVHYLAWKKGLKGLYYLRSEKGKRADSVGKQIELKDIIDTSECLACQ